MLLTRLALGLIFSGLIAAFALRRGSLSRSGAGAALAIGTCIYVGGGDAWFLALVSFFVTSTLLGKVGKARKAAIKREFEKGDTRDALQALSNGGVAALCALGMAGAPHPAWAAGFVAALATATGDTWATELGVLSRAEPWSLLSLRRVPRGTSGAVSGFGVLATLLGGTAIGVVAGCGAASFDMSPFALITLGAVSGLCGSMLDSLLGATLQRGFRCDHCARDTEGLTHGCGRDARHVRGFLWFDNDVVNLSATLGAAVVAGRTLWLFG